MESIEQNIIDQLRAAMSAAIKIAVYERFQEIITQVEPDTRVGMISSHHFDRCMAKYVVNPILREMREKVAQAMYDAWGMPIDVIKKLVFPIISGEFQKMREGSGPASDPHDTEEIQNTLGC